MLRMGCYGSYVSTTLVKKIVEIRAAASGLVDTCTWLPPISQAQLLAVIVEFFIAITPMALVVGQEQATNPSYVWSMAGSACLSLFFVGLLYAHACTRAHMCVVWAGRAGWCR